MKIHVRFKQGLDAYPKGTSHHLPEELADHYLRAGVAERVDVVPRPAVVVEKVIKPAQEAEQEKPGESEAVDGNDTKTTSSKRRSKT